MSLRALQFLKLVTPKLSNDIFYNLREHFSAAQIMELYQVLDIIVELNIDEINQRTHGKDERDIESLRSALDENQDELKALYLIETISKDLLSN